MLCGLKNLQKSQLFLSVLLLILIFIVSFKFSFNYRPKFNVPEVDPLPEFDDDIPDDGSFKFYTVVKTVNVIDNTDYDNNQSLFESNGSKTFCPKNSPYLSN